ncbi:MAG: DUF1491 family protein [Notoacmeibacter sp.]|nr:DUF1491 family protein [Notoacmeibacter sp.]MCC0033564.1 DUF1491 family protein [Brucellaceae bacterium]
MRLTTSLWASALVRRVFSSGGFAAILRHGADSAGAIFLIERTRLGSEILYGPAPQADYESGRPEERLFVRIAEYDLPGEAADRIAREARFDPDLWLVEIEPGADPLDRLVPLSAA